MKEDFFLSPALVTFEDFAEFLTALDQLIDSHSKAIAKYEDKLGVLLRGSEAESRGGMHFDQQQQDHLSLSNVDSAQQQPDPVVQGRGESNAKKKKGSPSQDASEQGWLVLEAEETSVKVASGNAASVTGKHVEALFKVIESLKAKLASLERIRKLVSDLPAQGFKANQRIIVMVRDGLPRQIIPSYEVVRAQKKFAYSEEFDIQALA